MAVTFLPAGRAGHAGSDARRTHAVVDSPIGPLTLVADDGVLTGLSMPDQRHLPEQLDLGEPDDGALAGVVEQLQAYFTGQLTEFDLIVAPSGTPFQRRVWAALTEIPYGRTEGYGQLANRIGAPGAARAVGLANGRNPVAVVVPCHRVIGASGALTGYGGGLERKQYLLALERVHEAPTDTEGTLFSLSVPPPLPAATYPRSHGGARPGVGARGAG